MKKVMLGFRKIMKDIFLEPEEEETIKPVIELPETKVEVKTVRKSMTKLTMQEAALQEMMLFLKNARLAFLERQKIGKGVELEHELNFGVDVSDIVITSRIEPPMITIKSLPKCITEDQTAQRKNRFKALINPLQKIMDKYPDVEFIIPELPSIDLTEDDDEELQDRLERLALEELAKREAYSKTNPEKFFKINLNKSFHTPMIFSFIPDEPFINFCENNLNPKYSKLFKEFHQYNDKEVIINCMKRDSLISVYENPIMNECLMYLVNKTAHKKYFTENFKIPEVINKLMKFGEPDKSKDEEKDGMSFSVGVELISSIYEQELHINFHKNYGMRVDIINFTEYVIDHTKELCFYNYNDRYSTSNLLYDKNSKIIKNVILNYCEVNKINKTELFYFNQYEDEEVKLEMFEKLVRVYQLLFSQYYNIYHEKNVSDDLFTKKETKTKADGDKQKPTN